MARRSCKVLGIDLLDDGAELAVIETYVLMQFWQIIVECMAEYDDWAVTKLRTRRIDFPSEAFSEHVFGFWNGKKASGTEAVRIWIATEKRCAIDEMAVGLDTDVIPVHAFQQILTMRSSLLDLTQLARVEDAETNLSQLFRVPDPALGVKANDDHVIG